MAPLSETETPRGCTGSGQQHEPRGQACRDVGTFLGTSAVMVLWAPQVLNVHTAALLKGRGRAHGCLGCSGQSR